MQNDPWADLLNDPAKRQAAVEAAQAAQAAREQASKQRPVTSGPSLGSRFD